MDAEKVTIGKCTLYLGDCTEVLSHIGQTGVVVTDPPYGIDFKYREHHDDPEAYVDLITCLSPYPKVGLQYPEEMMKFLVPAWGAPDDVYAWCYNSNTNRQMRLWGFWGVKPDWNAVKQRPKNSGDARVSDQVRSYDWCCDIQQVKNVSGEKTAHPCQVPTDLMTRVIAFTSAEAVIDPFMGSGTTGVACVKLNVISSVLRKTPSILRLPVIAFKQAYSQPDMFYETQ